MTTLKDKEITLPRAIKIAKESNWDTSTKVIPSKDVKEAVLTEYFLCLSIIYYRRIIE